MVAEMMMAWLRRGFCFLLLAMAGLPGVSRGEPVLADHEVASSQITSNTLRVLIFSFTSALLKNGTVANVPLTIASQ